MPDEYISREAALRAVQKQRGANRSPAQNAMLDRICCDIKNMPAADVAPVVRCKDCIYNIYGLCFCRRPLGNGVAVEPDDFCRWGEAE